MQAAIASAAEARQSDGKLSNLALYARRNLSTSDLSFTVTVELSSV